jgi:hypothetical protein
MDEIILQVVNKDDTYTRSTQFEFIMDRLNWQMAYVAALKAVDYISKPPKTSKMRYPDLIQRNGWSHTVVPPRMTGIQGPQCTRTRSDTKGHEGTWIRDTQ